MTTSHPRVAAVFATMNRRQTAEACVQRLAAQSRPPEQVWVADNCSTDGTAEGLEALADLPFDLQVIRMDRNRGNAGGVERAMEDAYASGADAVWILDDDSLPREGALEALLGNGWTGETVRHPLQIDPRGGGFTWPLQARDEAGGGWRLVDRIEDLPAGEVFETRAAWTGALIPRSIREGAGPVMGELFIRGEDEEYPWRIANAGFRFEAVRSAALDHPAPENLLRWDFLGRHFFLEPGLSDWKLYYKVRNMVWLKRRQSGLAAALMMGGAYVLGVLRVDGPGQGRLSTLSRAVVDGFRGRLGALSGPA